jgi:GT2 family glycosyltransferase
VVTAAVVSWNTRELLERCLRSLAGVDVWVVDNASHDGSAEMVRERFPEAHLIAAERNLGFGAAVNLVARRTDAPWLLVANADVALEPGALDALLAAAERDPGAGALAPRLVLPDGSTQHSVFAFPTVPFTAAFNLGLARVVPGLGDRLALIGHWDADRARRVPWAVGALLLVRRAAWEAAGGFDERQWMYAEDLDLGWRLRRAGWATRYVPSARVLHESGAATAQAWGEERTARWQRASYEWMLLRRGTARTRVTALINVLGAAVRYAALTPLARVAPARWAARRRTWRWWATLHAGGLEVRRP